MTRITMEQACTLVAAALQRAGANPAMAEATARALVLAEAQGLVSHGLSRVGQYSGHLRHGRVNGAAVPVVVKSKGAAAVDIRHEETARSRVTCHAQIHNIGSHQINFSRRSRTLDHHEVMSRPKLIQ